MIAGMADTEDETKNRVSACFRRNILSGELSGSSPISGKEPQRQPGYRYRQYVTEPRSLPGRERNAELKKRREFRHFYILSLAAAAVLLCVSLLAPSFAETAGGSLTVGVPTDRCPVFYRDADTDEIVGIGTDLMRLAAKEAGYASVTFVSIEEGTLKDALDNPAYDVVMPFGSAITSTSGQRTIVSDNLTETPFTLVTKGNREMPPMNQLRIGMLRSLGGAAETVRELYPGMEIVMYDTIADSVNALRKSDVDALLHNSYVWSYVLQKPTYSDLAVQPSAMFSMNFRAGTPDTPVGREIIERLNGGIASITDTHRQAIVLDYTTRRLYQYDFSDYLQEYGLMILLIICLIVAIVMIFIEKQRTYRLKSEEKMRRLVDHDELTGTLSLSGFRKKAEELLRAHPDCPYILAYANIRNFKYINDSLGKDAGDELLRFWIGKTGEVLTDEECFCRVEADRIAILLRAKGEEGIRETEEQVIEPTRNYFVSQGRETRIQICSGLYVLTPEDYHKIDIDRMLDYAHMAEKRVREAKKDGFEFYNPEQWEKGRRAAEIINLLPAAIRAGNIHVWYQPQVNGKTGKIIGAEALSRWEHEKLGWLYPPAFIEALEESGMIYELDRYVWDRVCQDLRRWNEQGIRRSVSVNVSRRDIRRERDIAGHFRNLIETYGLSPDQLRIEITETAFVEKPADLINVTEKLREYGFSVEMDDFGSGHSSLHMLKEVPVDRVKLDLHFLTDSGDPEKGRIIISYMIQMVRDLGMEMITEGVETEEQARFLLSRGCSEMQGFRFYKPMPVEEFERLGR